MRPWLQAPCHLARGAAATIVSFFCLLPMRVSATITVAGLFAGGISPLPPEGQSTGIFKQPVDGPCRLGVEGLAGDAQADRRVHGGPEKALHHYPAEHYTLLATAYPAIAAQLVPGSLGENLSSAGLTESAVCVGDVFSIGTARVQVSQPRSPCWKINHRFDTPSLSKAVAERGLTGWYYRVLQTGDIAAGDPIELIDRDANAVTLAELWQASLAHRPEPEALHRLAAARGLAQGWVRRLSDRLEWLRRDARPRS